jgi:Domain of unknown function (DUF927)
VNEKILENGGKDRNARNAGNELEKSGNYISKPLGHGPDPANAVISVVHVLPPLPGAVVMPPLRAERPSKQISQGAERSKRFATSNRIQESQMGSDARIEHYANVEDEATDSAYEIFRFDKVDGSRGVAQIARQIAGDEREVVRELLRLNANLPLNKDRASQEIRWAIRSRPGRALLHCEATGWRRDFSAFVTPTRVIDTRRRGPTLLPPLRLSRQQQRRQGATGSLDQWRKIPEICGYADLGMLLLAASFAAPLLAIAGRGSFGLNICGRTKVGKSVLLVAGSSVSGSGEESELPSWKDTAIGLDEKARHHNDLLFPINETGSLRRSEAYESIRQAIYALAEGRERDRHSGSGYATPESAARTIFIFSSEHSIDELARSAKASRDEGELARCLDIAATRSDRATVMDRFPGGLDSGEAEEWARRKLRALRGLCRGNHGLAIEEFVDYVMKDVSEVRREIREDVETFTRWYRPRDLSGAAAHAFDNVAMIYAGGSIAIDAKLLPYDKKRLAAAIWRCASNAILMISGQVDPLARAKQDLRVGIRNARLCRFVRDGMFDSDDFDGYVATRKGRSIHIVRARDFRAWFGGDPLRYRDALAWLERRGCLRPRLARRVTARHASDWAERAVKWPDGRMVRSIEFSDPFNE